MAQYRKIKCPVHTPMDNEPYVVCHGNPDGSTKFDPCADCPIDWDKLIIIPHKGW